MESESAYLGLNVLDLSSRLSGAFAARLFGDFGAEVLLAESESGHALRGEGPLFEGTSPVHAYANWNKRGTAYQALEDLEDLVRQAQLVICTDLDIAETVTPWLASTAVLLVVTAHGSRGSISRYPGNNLTASARTGWSYINRLRDEPPLQMPRHQSGYVGGIAGYIAASAALFRRDSESLAERVDVSEVEAFAHTVHPWGIMSIYADQGDSYGPAGWRPRGALSPLWPADNGSMHLAIGDFHNWTEAMNLLGLPDIAEDPVLMPDYGRHGRDLRGVVAALGESLPNMDRWDVFRGLAELRCVVGVVQDMDDLLKDPQYQAREYITATQIAGKTVRSAGAPLKLHSAPWRLTLPAPERSQRTDSFSSKGTQPSQRPKSDASGPLSGCRILSFGQAWSGTFGAEIFSLLGADVVQLGAIQRPDIWRQVRTDIPRGVLDETKSQHPLNTSGLYNAVNLNKRELTLNMKDPRGMELFWQLIPNFDILLDNFRATVMPGWGVSLEKLHALRPGIIWASISGYGTEGPYSDYPANGASTEPMSGFSSLHGYPGDSGMNTAGLYPDPISGYVLATGIMAALHHRERTGAPQRVDLAMMEAVTTLCGDAIIEYEIAGQVPRPTGNTHPDHAPHNNYLCGDDDWIAIAVETATQWAVLAQLIGGELMDDAWRELAYRKAHEQRLDQLITAYCQDKNAVQLEALLCRSGLIAARVMPLYELYSQAGSPMHENGFIQEVVHPEAGPSFLPGSPWCFSQSNSMPLRPSPCVGEHSKEILSQELGLSDEQYAELVAAGITGTLADHNLYS